MLIKATPYKARLTALCGIALIMHWDSEYIIINKKITYFISAAAIAIASVPVITSNVDTTGSAIVFASEEYSVPNLNIAGKTSLILKVFVL